MNWQLTGQPGMEGQLPVQGSQELLTWGPNPTHMQHDRCRNCLWLKQGARYS
jgi:hypothetical protein